VWKYLLMVVVLQIVLALVAYKMVRLASQRDKDLLDGDGDALEPASARQQK
jgi:hypothetical protein